MENLMSLWGLYMLLSAMIVLFAVGGHIAKYSLNRVTEEERWMHVLSKIVFNKPYLYLSAEEEIQLILFRNCMLPDTVREAVEIMDKELKDFVLEEWDGWLLK